MAEIWKDIEGYEGLYQISNMGRVRSLNYMRTEQTRIMKPQDNGHGYLQVLLSKNGKKKQLYIHRLVACAFIPNPRNWPQINHKNELKSNNVVDNLEWCDRIYNIRYGTAIKRMAAKHSKSVLQYDMLGNLLKTWPSTREIERQTGFAQTAISACCLGKCKTAYKYIWRYA